MSQRDEQGHYTIGWDRVEPGTERYYGITADQALIYAKERCAEWRYRGDEHNYCHERSTLVALIKEVERLRAGVSDA